MGKLSLLKQISWILNNNHAMSVEGVVDLIQKLSRLGKVSEELFRITIEGTGLSIAAVTLLQKIGAEVTALDLDPPTYLIKNEFIELDELPAGGDSNLDEWRVVVGKRELCKKLPNRKLNSALFMSECGFLKWLEKEDPFFPSASFQELFNGTPVTLYVAGLKNGFWGPGTVVLGLRNAEPEIPVLKRPLPSNRAVQESVRVISGRQVTLSPEYWSLIGGDLSSESAIAFARKSIPVLAICLSQQIVEKDGEFLATFKGGGKKSELKIAPSIDDISGMEGIISAITWAYEERTETRLKLLADRIAVDADESKPVGDAISPHVSEALQQAKDSYDFVISERKDAFHKEVRDFMKDMKAQADLYAAKVRDLVASLTRDIIGILVLVGFSFIGKFDAVKLQEMISSKEFKLLTSMLSIYLFLSGVLIIWISQRDAAYGYREVVNWFTILQNYTSKDDFRQRVLGPLDDRRKFLFFMMWVIGIMYVALIFTVWNLPRIVKFFTAQ